MVSRVPGFIHRLPIVGWLVMGNDKHKRKPSLKARHNPLPSVGVVLRNIWLSQQLLHFRATATQPTSSSLWALFEAGFRDIIDGVEFVPPQCGDAYQLFRLYEQCDSTRSFIDDSLHCARRLDAIFCRDKVWLIMLLLLHDSM